jgi:hypothetical protein
MQVYHEGYAGAITVIGMSLAERALEVYVRDCKRLGQSWGGVDFLSLGFAHLDSKRLRAQSIPGTSSLPNRGSMRIIPDPPPTLQWNPTKSSYTCSGVKLQTGDNPFSRLYPEESP